MQKKNYYAIDIAKFVSALLVICIHTGPLVDINMDANFVLVQVLSRVAVPFFFITSGFFFFQKIDLHREWNDYENIQVLKHYLGRLFKIYIIWTILYLPFTYWIMRSGDGVTFAAILRYVRDFFFMGSFYHLWFLPALMFAVFAVYYLVTMLNVKKTIWITLLLYLIGMMGNVYPQLLEGIPVVDFIWKYYVDIFSTTRNGLFFGMIFIALGAYFSKHMLYVKKPVLFVGFLISLALLFGECYLLKANGFMSDLASMYVMLIPCVSFLFLWLKRMDLQKQKIYRTLRQMSLLVYVSHIMFVSVLIWTMPELNSLLGYLICVAASLVFSYVILWVSRRIHILKAVY